MRDGDGRHITDGLSCRLLSKTHGAADYVVHNIIGHAQDAGKQTQSVAVKPENLHDVTRYNDVLHTDRAMSIEYPWHPLHGQQLRLIRKAGKHLKPVFCVEVRNGLCRDLPAWMFRRLAMRQYGGWAASGGRSGRPGRTPGDFR